MITYNTAVDCRNEMKVKPTDTVMATRKVSMDDEINLEFVKQVMREVSWTEKRMKLYNLQWLLHFYGQVERAQDTFIIKPVSSYGGEFYIYNQKEIDRSQRREWRRSNKVLRK